MLNLIEESFIKQCEIVLETFVKWLSNEFSGVELLDNDEETAVSTGTIESQLASQGKLEAKIKFNLHRQKQSSSLITMTRPKS